MPEKIDPELRQWATPRQVEFIEAIEKHGSMNAAAIAMGLSAGSISNSMRGLKAKAARLGYAPGHWTGGVAPGYVTGKVTVAVNAKTGEVERYWQRQHPEASRLQEMMRAASEAMAESLPRVHAVPTPKHVDEALCNLYTFTDCHVGALAWHREGGSDWDLKIAEQTLVATFAHMVQASPPAKIGFINQLGDFLHSDGSNGLMPVTPMHGHILDQDGRYAKVVATAIRILRRIVDFALERHEQVIVLLAEGNHDMSSSIWLRAMFSALYENEPRVKVIQSELPYYVYQHGKTMLAFHHGHLKKNDDLPLLFAAQFPKVWGDTSKRICHVGHRHHVEEREHSGMLVVQHPTIAARDAYAARGGWFAERSATAITYHRDFGQVARHTIVPEMFSVAA
ncbi:hypothetical protein [Burkholderia glumae]|uniref:hypothetical protein n=1 Tax=Burkholderia glumae TaxID=337 RepID=UPI003B99AB6D